MAQKNNHQVATLWSKDFEELDINKDEYILGFTSILFAITLEDYVKFFSKI